MLSSLIVRPYPQSVGEFWMVSGTVGWPAVLD